jgi:hypothetical protein
VGQVVAACLVLVPVALVALVLVLFLLYQVFDTWRKEGIRAACALAFTSIVLFPPLAVVEAVEACFFPPSMPERMGQGSQHDPLEAGLQASARLAAALPWLAAPIDSSPARRRSPWRASSGTDARSKLSTSCGTMCVTCSSSWTPRQRCSEGTT